MTFTLLDGTPHTLSITKLRPGFYLSFYVSLGPEETAASLLEFRKKETMKTFLSLSIDENNMLKLNHSNISLQAQVGDPSCFFVKIRQVPSSSKVRIMIFTI